MVNDGLDTVIGRPDDNLIGIFQGFGALYPQPDPCPKVMMEAVAGPRLQVQNPPSANADPPF